MIPFLSGQSGILAGSPTSLVPPPRFRPLRGQVTEARCLLSIGYDAAAGTTDAQRAGLRYEAKVQQFLKSRFPAYEAAPWLHFLDDKLARTAQPDGVLKLNNFVVIFEIKHQHCPEAWWQLERLYRPVIEVIWPNTPVMCIEVCRSYDPSMPFPCPVTLIEKIDEWCSEPRKEFGVYACRR